MSNSNTAVFGIKTMQSLLREVKLYGGRIDGLFGDNCRNGFIAMLKKYDASFNKQLPVNSYDSESVFTLIQTGLAAIGFYTTRIDGLWGPGTLGAFSKLVEAYRASTGTPRYGFAWSGHPNVPSEGVEKYLAWMRKWDKPDDHVSYILSCNALETGRTFDPAIRNRHSGAVGLIQFMPKGSALDLGTTADELAKMSFVEQQDYVFKYFEKYGYIKKCKRLEDYYLSIFMPAMVGRNPNDVIGRAGTKLYDQNKGFDSQKKGYYTVGDIGSTINQFYWDGLDPKNRVIITP